MRSQTTPSPWLQRALAIARTLFTNRPFVKSLVARASQCAHILIFRDLLVEIDNLLKHRVVRQIRRVVAVSRERLRKERAKRARCREKRLMLVGTCVSALVRGRANENGCESEGAYVLLPA
eukprot:1402778-Pleurochrysis_carterae.AAC.1